MVLEASGKVGQHSDPVGRSMDRVGRLVDDARQTLVVRGRPAEGAMLFQNNCRVSSLVSLGHRKKKRKKKTRVHLLVVSNLVALEAAEGRAAVAHFFGHPIPVDLFFVFYQILQKKKQSKMAIGAISVAHSIRNVHAISIEHSILTEHSISIEHSVLSEDSIRMEHSSRIEYS